MRVTSVFANGNYGADQNYPFQLPQPIDINSNTHGDYGSFNVFYFYTSCNANGDVAGYANYVNTVAAFDFSRIFQMQGPSETPYWPDALVSDPLPYQLGWGWEYGFVASVNVGNAGY